MVGLEDEPWWKETGLKLRQCFHESECVKGRVVSLCDRLWISLISLSRGVMGLREAHRSLIFCPDFPISSAVGIRSRDIWKFWFYICNHVNCYLQIGHTSTLYAVGSQQEGDGSVLGWLCAPGDHVTKGDTDSQCPWGPGAPRGAANPTPEAGTYQLNTYQSWTFLGGRDRTQCWASLMFGYCV